MGFFSKLFKPSKTSKNRARSRSASRSRSRSSSRGRSRSRARYVGGSELSPADYSAGPDSGASASDYMLKTVGNVSDQMNNLGNTNTIQPLSGSLSGGRRRRKTRGGFMGEVLRQGVVPAALVGMSLYKGNRLHQGKSYRSKIRSTKSKSFLN
jgi:hypothetical protein